LIKDNNKIIVEKLGEGLNALKNFEDKEIPTIYRNNERE